MADLRLILDLIGRDNFSPEARRARQTLDDLQRAADLASTSGHSLARSGDAAGQGLHRLSGGAMAASVAVGMLAANLATNLAQRGFEAATQAVFGMNSTLETATLRFKILMGDADLAKEHVASLFEFAKATPFETAPIIEASRILETFGGAALNTMENLTLFGDTAAATGAPLDTLTQYIGRMYASLQSGKPFGESLERFRELGVLTPQVSAQLSEISEKGGDASRAWQLLTTDLSRFNGAMVEQAGTWQGVTSTFSDTTNILLSSTLKPFFEAAKSGLGELNELLGSDMAAQWSADMAQRFTEVLNNLGTMKDSWLDDFEAIRGNEEGLGTIDAALKATADLIGREFGERAKQDFETTTGAVASLSTSIGVLAETMAAVVAPLVAAGDAIRFVGDMARAALGPLIEFQRQRYAAIAAERATAEQPFGPEIPPGLFPPTVDITGVEDAFLAGLEGGGPGRPPRRGGGGEDTLPTAPPRRGGGGGGGRKAAGKAAAETAIDGFMEALANSEATFEAAFGKVGGKAASALSKAIADNTKASGSALAKAMEDVITDLREAGIEDWRATGDELAEALHDALVQKTPDVTAAAMELIGSVSRQAQEARFWKDWEKAGTDSADKVNTAILDGAAKIADAWDRFHDSVRKAQQALTDTRWLEAQRDVVSQIVQMEAARRTEAASATARSIEEGERQIAGIQARQDIEEARRRAVRGATTPEAKRAANEQARQAVIDLEKREAREADAAERRRGQQAVIRNQQEEDAKQLNILRLQLEQQFGIDKKALEDRALADQIKNLETARDESIKNANEVIRRVAEAENERLFGADGVWTKLEEKFNLLHNADGTGILDEAADGFLEDMEAAEAIFLRITGGGGSTGGAPAGASGGGAPGPWRPPSALGGSGTPGDPWTYQHGGFVPRTGHAILHAGEYVIPNRAGKSPAGVTVQVTIAGGNFIGAGGIGEVTDVLSAELARKIRNAMATS